LRQTNSFLRRHPTVTLLTFVLHLQKATVLVEILRNSYGLSGVDLGQ